MTEAPPGLGDGEGPAVEVPPLSFHIPIPRSTPAGRAMSETPGLSSIGRRRASENLSPQNDPSSLNNNDGDGSNDTELLLLIQSTCARYCCSSLNTLTVLNSHNYPMKRAMLLPPRPHK